MTSIDIHDYLDFIDSQGISGYKNSKLISKHVTFFSKETDLSKLKYDIALLGVPDSVESKLFESAAQIRKQFYALASFSNNLNIVDLGNIKTGHTFNDVCYAMREVVSILADLNIVVIPLGGSSQFNLGSFLAFERKKLPVNMISIDSVLSREKIPLLYGFDSGLVDTVDSTSIYNFINIGYQSYFVDKEFVDFVNDSFYEAYRLGYVRSNLQEMEPSLRDANLIAFSLNAVKHCDAPGVSVSSPNGLTGEEACQLAFYAGHSPRIKSFGIFDFSFDNDIHQTTAKLAAQIIWYFIEGQSSSIYEEPDTTPENFVKYVIHLDQTNQNIAFFKSSLTNRWWMEISAPEKHLNILLSCSELDYELACRQDIPERWWRTFQRLNY
jgi:Arginase/agmatinase/formimionoglutamate hydrolase, arginase family